MYLQFTGISTDEEEDMTGLVVVAHFSLAKEMVAATELIVGKQKQFEAVDIFPDEHVDTIKEKIVQALKKDQSGDGIIILTDMFGGTPSNISLSFLEEGKVEVVAGVNLPMLIKLVTFREGRKSMNWPTLLPNMVRKISTSPRMF